MYIFLQQVNSEKEKEERVLRSQTCKPCSLQAKVMYTWFVGLYITKNVGNSLYALQSVKILQWLLNKIGMTPQYFSASLHTSCVLCQLHIPQTPYNGHTHLPIHTQQMNAVLHSIQLSHITHPSHTSTWHYKTQYCLLHSLLHLKQPTSAMFSTNEVYRITHTLTCYTDCSYTLHLPCSVAMKL